MNIEIAELKEALTKKDKVLKATKLKYTKLLESGKVPQNDDLPRALAEIAQLKTDLQSVQQEYDELRRQIASPSIEDGASAESRIALQNIAILQAELGRVTQEKGLSFSSESNLFKPIACKARRA